MVERTADALVAALSAGLQEPGSVAVEPGG
jgi:hypothetical protein